MELHSKAHQLMHLLNFVFDQNHYQIPRDRLFDIHFVILQPLVQQSLRLSRNQEHRPNLIFTLQIKGQLQMDLPSWFYHVILQVVNRQP